MKTDIKTKKTPLPSQAEILHFLAKAFSLEASNQQLKDYIKHGDANFRTKQKVIDEVFIRPLTKYAGTEFTALVKWALEKFFDEYISNIVCKINFDTTTRPEAMNILARSYFPVLCANLLEIFHEHFNGPSVNDLLSGNSSLRKTFEWLEANHYSVLDNTRDNNLVDVSAHNQKMELWFSGQHLPSYTDLKGMLTFANVTENDKTAILCWLLLARAIDWVKFKGDKTGVLFCSRLIHYSTTGEKVSAAELESPLEKYRKKYLALSQADDRFRDLTKSIFHSLSPQRMPIENPDILIKNEYARLVRLHKHHDKKGLLNYRLEQFKIFLYSKQQDDLALKHIESAFKQSLYRSGEHQEILFKMAYGIAKGNQSVQTRLKNQAIAFGWFEPPAENDSKSSRPDVLYSSEKNSHSKNDTRLIELALKNDVDGVREMLTKKRGSVDTLSVEGKSVYLIAIERAQMAGDHNLINLLLKSEASPKPKTLNTRDFDGNTPLIKAVQYGYVKIVQKLIEWKADPNLKAAETARSPLMLAVEQLLSLYKPEMLPNPIGLIEKGEPRILENLRRHLINAGLVSSGIKLSELNEWHSKILKDPRKRDIMNHVVSQLDSRENRDISAYKKIVNLLLNAAADPNQTHEYPIPGYTPLMLAAETNDIDLFKQLEKAGGNSKKSYQRTDTLEHVGCLEIAKQFKSESIVTYLKSGS